MAALRRASSILKTKHISLVLVSGCILVKFGQTRPYGITTFAYFRPGGGHFGYGGHLGFGGHLVVFWKIDTKS